MKIATWNVNSIKVRLEHLIKWMDLARIDAVVLQETKTVDELFPLAELQAAGFDAVFLGQKTYNGVALVTRKSTIRSVSDVVYNIPGYPDEQKRMIAADIEHVSGTKLRFAGVYVPNGTELGSNRYLYKLDWMSALTTWVREQLQSKTPLVLAGDFNVATPTSGIPWLGRVSFWFLRPNERHFNGSSKPVLWTPGRSVCTRPKPTVGGIIARPVLKRTTVCALTTFSPPSTSPSVSGMSRSIPCRAHGKNRAIMRRWSSSLIKLLMRELF